MKNEQETSTLPTAVAEHDPIEFAIVPLSTDGKISLIARAIREIMPELETQIRLSAMAVDNGAHNHIEHARLHRIHSALCDVMMAALYNH